MGWIPGPGRSPGEENDKSLQYSCLDNALDRGAWWATVFGVADSAMTKTTEHTPMQNRSTDCDFQNPSMDFDIWTGEVQHGDLLTLKSRFRLGEFISLFFFSQKLSGIYTLIKPQPFWEMKT